MKFLVMSLMFVCLSANVSFASDIQEKFSQVQTQEVVGKIVSIDQKDSSFNLEYETDDSAHEIKTATFYVTDITAIDIMMVKGGLSDLKEGQSVLAEYAQMPDGTKVVDAVWVKKI